MSGKVTNPAFRLLLMLCLICAGLSAVFLLKGEDTTYFEFHASRSFGTAGISALTYYFVWPEAKREEVSTKESVVAVLNAMGGGDTPSTLPDRMKRNLALAIAFGVLSAMLGIATWVRSLSRSRA
jgi:hypothetical protein